MPYLNSLLFQDGYLNASQVETLTNLANQCPDASPMVYKARAYLPECIEVCELEIDNHEVGYAKAIEADSPLVNREERIHSQISLFPNPVQDVLTVYIPDDLFSESQSYYLSIIDFTGKRLKQHMPLSNSNTEISVSDYPSGIYLVQLYDRQNRLIDSQKITVQ